MAVDDRRRKQIPLGLFGMLAAVLAVEAAIDRHAPEFTATGALDRRTTGRVAAQESATRSDVLCFGDSLVKFAVQPKVIEARTGRSTYNLALFGGSIPVSHTLLRRALEHGAWPSVIVVDFERQQARRPPRTRAHPLPLVRTARPARPRRADPPGRRRLPPRAARGRAYAGFGPVAARRAEAVVASFGGTTPEGRGSTAILVRNWRRNRGAVANREPSNRTEPIDVAAGADLDATAWRPDPRNVHHLRRFLDLAADRGIPVVWLLPPVTPELQALNDRSASESRYLAFVRRIQADFPDVAVVDARHAGFPLTAFTDPVHLDRQGATVLSDDGPPPRPRRGPPASVRDGNWPRLDHDGGLQRAARRADS